MIKQTVKYLGYQDKEVEEVIRFNLDESEIMKLQVMQKEGFEAYIERIIKAEDNKEIFDTLEEIIMLSYGEQSPDGRYFFKEDENGHKLVRKFKASRAYAAFLTDLMTGDSTKKISDFVNGLLPSDLRAKVEEMRKTENQNNTETNVIPISQA